MKSKNFEYFFFIENLNIINIDKLKKFKNIYIIYYYNKIYNFKYVIKLYKLYKKKKIKL